MVPVNAPLLKPYKHVMGGAISFGNTVEPLNVDSLKKGPLLYSGHFVLFQRDIKGYEFTPEFRIPL